MNAFHDKLVEYGIDMDLDELKRILPKGKFINNEKGS